MRLLEFDGTEVYSFFKNSEDGCMCVHLPMFPVNDRCDL